ncbi:hypothetical protein CKA32_005898 [Geitlerinema sp. FC II]|nr:hypothetical protein CKA32_005898 [Geitlerinema sp. FC II]
MLKSIVVSQDGAGNATALRDFPRRDNPVTSRRENEMPPQTVL